MAQFYKLNTLSPPGPWACTDNETYWLTLLKAQIIKYLRIVSKSSFLTVLLTF